jgi:hypothetical protein
MTKSPAAAISPNTSLATALGTMHLRGRMNESSPSRRLISTLFPGPQTRRHLAATIARV